MTEVTTRAFEFTSRLAVSIIRPLFQGRIENGLGDPILPGFCADRRIEGIEDQLSLSLHQIVIGAGRPPLDPLRVIEKRSQVADPADTGVEAGRRLTLSDPLGGPGAGRSAAWWETGEMPGPLIALPHPAGHRFRSIPGRESHLPWV